MILRQRRAMLSPRLRPLVALAPVALAVVQIAGGGGMRTATKMGNFSGKSWEMSWRRMGDGDFLWDKYDIVQCGAPKIAKLVYNSNDYGLWMFMVLITIVMGVYKPTYNLGAPHCMIIIR